MPRTAVWAAWEAPGGWAGVRAAGGVPEGAGFTTMRRAMAGLRCMLARAQAAFTSLRSGKRVRASVSSSSARLVELEAASADARLIRIFQESSGGEGLTSEGRAIDLAPYQASEAASRWAERPCRVYISQ